MSTKNIKDLANGKGLLYKVSPDSSKIIQAYPNTCEGYEELVSDINISSPLAGKIDSQGLIEITIAGAGAQSLDDVTLNGVSILGNVVNFDADTDTAAKVAKLVEAEINATLPASGPRPFAIAVDNKVTIQVPGTGDQYDGYALVANSTGASTFTPTNLVGGTNESQEVNEKCGYRYYIQADYGATGACSGDGTADPDNLTGALEITDVIVPIGVQSPVRIQEKTSAPEETITYTRKRSLEVIDIRNGGASFDISSLTSEGTVNGDTVMLRNIANGVVVKHNTGNIFLASETDYTMVTSKYQFLELQYVEAINKWVETTRSKTFANKDTLRDNKIIAQSQGYRQYQVLAAGGTTTIDPGEPTTTKNNRFYTSALVALSNDYVIEFDDIKGVLKVGEEFFFHLDVDIDLNGKKFVIDGKLLNQDELNGAMTVHCIYNGSGWEQRYYYNFREGESLKPTIRTANIKNDAITADKIATNAVTSDAVLASAITSAKIGTEAVTNSKIAASAVTLDKVTSSLTKEVLIIPFSLDSADEIGEIKVRMPYKVTVVRIIACVSKTIEASNDGTLVPKNDAGTIMTDGTLTLPAGTTVGTDIASTPTADNVIDAGGYLKIQGLKTTVGGKAVLSIDVTRTT